MEAKRILSWFTSFVEGVRQSRITTVVALVEALLRSQHVGVTLLGRELRGVSKPRYGIKRVDRFLGNDGVEVREFQKSIACMLRKRSKTTWFVAMDWTSLGKDRFQMLTASVAARGRAFPLLWMTVAANKLKGRKTDLVCDFLDHLREVIPADQPVVVLADREFGNAIIARRLCGVGFQYVLRCRGNIRVNSSKFSGCFDAFELKRGAKIHVLPEAELTARRAEPMTAVLTWQKGQKEPWYLAARIDGPSDAAVGMYGKRFRIEEFFRDGKETRFGLKLDKLALTEAGRYDRMMILIALAYLVWSAVGEWAARTGKYRDVQTNGTALRTLSIFRLGKHFLSSWELSLADVFDYAALSVDSNWG